MAEIIDSLLSNAIVEEKIILADDLINTFDLSITAQEIVNMFESEILNIKRSWFGTDLIRRIKYLCNTLLNCNKNLLVIMIKYTYKKNKQLSSYVRNEFLGYKIGFYDNNELINEYKKLLDYDDFDFDGIVLTHDDRLELCKYRNKKYSGKFSKLAEHI